MNTNNAHCNITVTNNAITLPTKSAADYHQLIAATVCEFTNDMLSYSQMVTIAAQELELLIIAESKNGKKINIAYLAPRNIRLAILNRLNKIAA